MPGPSKTPRFIKYCVAAVADQYGGDTDKAFAICVGTLQKYGYLKPGTMELTAKGKKRQAELEAEPDADKKLKAYEKFLKAAREVTAAERDEREAKMAKSRKSESVGERFNRDFERLIKPTENSGFENLPRFVSQRYESISQGESSMDAMRRLAGIGSSYESEARLEASAPSTEDPVEFMRYLAANSSPYLEFDSDGFDIEVAFHKDPSLRSPSSKIRPDQALVTFGDVHDVLSGDRRDGWAVMDFVADFDYGSRRSGDSKKKVKYTKDSMLTVLKQAEKFFRDVGKKYGYGPKAESIQERTKYLHDPQGNPENEGEMAKAHLGRIALLAGMLDGYLIDEDQLPGWVQQHIAVAMENLEQVVSYMEPKSRK